MQGDPDLEPGSLKRCQGDCDSDEGEIMLVGILHIADRKKNDHLKANRRLDRMT